MNSGGGVVVVPADAAVETAMNRPDCEGWLVAFDQLPVLDSGFRGSAGGTAFCPD
jgi:hypothetical protein